MTKIFNKKISVLVNITNAFGQAIIENGKPVERLQDATYSELIMTCVKRPKSKESGYTYDEIKSIDRIKTAIDSIDEISQEISIHPVDLDFVKDRVSTMTWGVPSIEFVNFMDYIKDLK